jgi:hypothetical protein
MKQKAHAWVALRALKLVEDLGKEDTDLLVELLSYYMSDVWEGAWLPDTLIRDMSYGHIFKMDSDDNFVETISSKTHRKITYSKLKSETKGKRLCLEDYLKDSGELRKPYWAPDAGGHLPDRVIAINHSIVDMLKMGDFPIAFYLKKTKPDSYMKDLTKKKVKDLSLSPNFSARQIALTLFILSHYICDAHMPLHCDLRDMKAQKLGNGTKERRLPRSLHPGIEAVWEDSFPDKSRLALHAYTTDSINEIVTELPNGSLIELDTNASYKMNTKLYKNMPNEWDEMVNICRISYGVSRKWISKSFAEIEACIGEDKCLEKATALKYEDIIKIIGEKEFKDVTNRIFHDAVESVARLWYRAWEIFIR